MVGLTEDRTLFVRMFVVCKARYVKFNQTVARDSSMLQATSKWDLISVLEGLPKDIIKRQMAISSMVLEPSSFANAL